MALPKTKPDYSSEYSATHSGTKSPTLLTHPPQRTAAQNACIALGVAFLVVGVAGMAIPGLLGTHLSGLHNLIHFVSGFLALAFGLRSNSRPAMNFCFGFGTLYALLGVLGFVIGEPGISSTPHIDIDNNLWALIPGSLEFGTNDHVLHVVIGAAFITAGFITRAKNTIEIDRKTFGV